MRDPGRELETLREKLKNGDRGGNEEDRELLLDFDRAMRLIRSEVGEHRSLKLLRHATRISEEAGGLAQALEDRGAAEEIKIWIEETYENEETNRDYRMALRMVGKRTGDDDEIPDSLAWIPTGTSNDYDPRPDPSEMLEWEAEVKPMIEACRNSRDKALIAVAFDAGLRGGELEKLAVGQVSDGDHGLRLQVDGKTGQRTVPLIPSTPYLQRWLADHPGSGNPEDPLWCKLSEPEKISYRMFLKAFKEAGRRAGVEKTVTPTNFRKSNATWLARQRANAATIEELQGRSRGSKAVARYVAAFGPDSAERAKAKLHGLEVQETDGPEQIAPVTCPRCERDTPSDEDFCVFCRQALNLDAVTKAQTDTRELRKAFLRFVKEEPELVDEAEKATRMMEMFQRNPELAEEARQFADALGEV
jgi:hypothetical protein